MFPWRVNVYVADSFQGLVKAARLRKVAAKTLEAYGGGRPGKTSLAIVGDEEMRRMSKASRGLDEVTDVLSFSFEAGDFPRRPRSLPLLGEVVLCYPQAERQAREMGHPVERELSVLVIHGVLHLLGYDHEKEADAESMTQAEAHALALLS
ncbi:MAG: rRNA maturation RNase YbeY [Chloroflexi bacterium]|nr:rRNA maturation RNase YbeY [Chloroflexota bacterium]